jgi:hypothetical protein
MSTAPLPRFAISLAVLVSLSAPAYAAPFVVTPGLTAAQMAALLVGAGISIVPGSEIYTGDGIASGSFTGGTGILPFDAGIILTSGSANGALGPNSQSGFTEALGIPGDADLNALIAGTTLDASVLQFDFTSSSSSVSFQYVFASEEYDEFAGSPFNDVFAFFLNGANIALLPVAGNPAVSINNVNCGTNPSFYTGNNSDGGGSFGSCGNAGLDTQYDGLVGVSTALFATGTLLPGVNRIRLAIADTDDELLDSAVFMRASSFVSPVLAPPTPGVPEPATLALVGTGMLFAMRGTRRRR